MKRTTLSIVAVLFAIALGHSTAAGQPPPLGPPNYKSDTNQLPVSLLTNLVNTTVDDAVRDANVQIHKDHPHISVQKTGVTTYLPSRRPTLAPDRPNEVYVDVPMMITLNVSIPATSDRTIAIALDINASCDGWQTGSGTLKLVSVMGTPVVEGGNIVEDVLGEIFHVGDVVNNTIRNNLPALPSVSVTFPAKCVTIGAFIPSDRAVVNSAIAFDPPPTRRIIISRAGDSVLNSNVTVTFLRLKRLTARGNGSVLYQATESILLSTYTDFDYRQVNLTMKEGDDVALSVQPVVLKPPLFDSLVVIANIAQEPNLNPEDSSWFTTLASAGFSPGVHKIIISKKYFLPPGPGHPKPVPASAPAYELTYSISYPKPTNIAPSAR